MAINFSLYYRTPENCDYLKKVITSSRQGKLVEAKPLAELPEMVNSGANAVFLEYENDDPDLDQWIKKTAADHRNPPIFLYLQEITTEQLWKALRLGVKECFVFPIRPEEFQEALDRLPVFPIEPGAGDPTRVVALLGCKGGVGTTFMAVNAAYLLAQEDKGQVLAADLDLRYGQMVYFFDAKPQYTIVEVIENADHLDHSYLQSLFYQYDKNLQLMPAPLRLEDAEIVTPEQLEKVISYLKKLRAFRTIVMDVGHQVDEVALKSLELADDVVLVTNQMIPALSNAKKLLEVLQLVGLENLNLQIWLNAWQKHGDLSLNDVAGFLGREVAGAVQFDLKESTRSINEGVPLAKLAPNLGVCRDLQIFAARLGGKNGQDKKASRWGLLNLFRR
ncbi:MAG: AAA family ATPase [Deltaproteobacteria bacterium]|nr:AAA family ATPase [Deltaproteobacteria bacterium]